MSQTEDLLQEMLDLETMGSVRRRTMREQRRLRETSINNNRGEVHFHHSAPTPEPEPFVIEADVEGYELCPDPLQAHGVADFVALLARYRLWAGAPSFREMERRCQRQAAASTFCKMLKKTDELPAQHLVRAFIRGCAGDDQALRAWVTAWRRLQMGLTLEEEGKA